MCEIAKYYSYQAARFGIQFKLLHIRLGQLSSLGKGWTSGHQVGIAEISDPLDGAPTLVTEIGFG